MNKHATRVAVITGAANGLGKAMVIGLLRQGLHVAAVDRDIHALSTLQTELAHEYKDGLLDTFASDLALDDTAELISCIRHRFEHIDILINNAGIGVGQFRPDYHVNPPRFYDVPPEQWTKAIAVNASAVFMLSHAVVKPMVERGWGRIINVTTSLGTMMRYGTAPYGPSKAAAESLSAVMAADLADTGVTVNVIIPGGTANTPMVPDNAPFKREELIQPDIMLPPLFWLLSDEANGVTSRRYIGIKWDPSLQPSVAAEEAGAPIGWPGLAVLPVAPTLEK